MFSAAELRFAQKYPFCRLARKVVAGSGLRLDSIPSPVLRRACAMVSAAFSGHGYMPRIESSQELLMDEVLAFPVAKILVSLINRLELYRRFSAMVSGAISRNLESEKDNTLSDMASEIGMRFDLSSSQDIFAEVNLADYLKPDLDDKSVKLVNQRIASGKVFLSRKEFIVLLSMAAGQGISSSLPVDTKAATPALRKAAEELDMEFSASVRKTYSKTDFGAVSPESFPPCMTKIYSELMSGMNVGHSARFAMATFLNSIGMAPEKIVDAYRHTPNFNEKVTRYQVMRLVSGGRRADKPGATKEGGVLQYEAREQVAGYSSPGCDKMRSYNLCVANCPVTHPVQFYSREVMRGKNVAQSGQDE